MNEDFADALAAYDYALSKRLIAQEPATPRDSARLLVHDREPSVTRFSTVRHIGEFLPARSLLVLNQTKVIPARLYLTRATGGRVAILSLGVRDGCVVALSNRKLKVHETLTLIADRQFVVRGVEGKHWVLEPTFPAHELHDIFDRHGVMPLPPYIKETPLTAEEQRERYQSVFAQDEGSIAAPTASLHFTPELLDHLRQQGIELAHVTLHVHLGTFAPLTEEQWRTGQLHHEEYEIDEDAQRMIERARSDGRSIIAVGTTVVRTLESASDASGHIIKPKGTTDLFIREGYRFRLVTGLLTNFHVPRSSLMMLVSSFLGSREQLLHLYQEAINEEMRFFSFGDAMLIL